jgi:hypothetical protein
MHVGYNLAERVTIARWRYTAVTQQGVCLKPLRLGAPNETT